MPTGDIVPKTDGFTRESILLGAEEFPSAIQQAMCANHGYLMYKPVHICNDRVILEGGETGDSGTYQHHTYIMAGVYDIYAKLGSSDVLSCHLKFDGTTILSAGGEGSLDSFSLASDAWIRIDTGMEVDGAWDIGSLAWALASRQYEEA